MRACRGPTPLCAQNLMSVVSDSISSILLFGMLVPKSRGRRALFNTFSRLFEGLSDIAKVRWGLKGWGCTRTYGWRSAWRQTHSPRRAPWVDLVHCTKWLGEGLSLFQRALPGCWCLGAASDEG